MRKSIITACCLLSTIILSPHVNASINSDLIEAMKDAATPNKSVSREEWIAGIDALGESLVKADALISSDGGNKKIYFDGIKNNLTNGKEHKFIEDRLCELLEKDNIECDRQSSDEPFPANFNGLILKGSIDNSSVMIGNEKALAYSMQLEIVQNQKTVWKDSVMLVPGNSQYEEEPVVSQTIVTGAIMKPHFRPLRPCVGSSRPILIINNNGVRVIPTGRHRMHPYSPRSPTVIVMPRPQVSHPAPPPRPTPRPRMR